MNFRFTKLALISLFSILGLCSCTSNPWHEYDAVNTSTYQHRNIISKNDFRKSRISIEDLGLSFTNEQFVNPAMIKEFITWLDDEDEQIIAQNISGTKQSSNRFTADVKSKMVPASKTHPLVYYH